MEFLVMVPLRLARVIRVAGLPFIAAVWFMEAVVTAAAFAILVGAALLYTGIIPPSTLQPVVDALGRRILDMLHTSSATATGSVQVHVQPPG